MATFNRGKLRRLAEAGRLVTVSSYSFDDMYGESRTDQEMPVVCPMPPDHLDRREGIVYLRPDHFTSSCGGAYVGARSDLVTLHVHSNLNYTFRILPVAPKH